MEFLTIILLAIILIGVLILVFRKSENNLSEIIKTVQEEFRTNRAEINQLLKDNRGELSNSLKIFAETQERLIKTIENKLKDIQNDNTKQLDKMRETVDEKLQKTLETRLSQSFKLVSERLEAVQKGLGEMQNLATDVGDLQKVLSNVKTKGVFGEYQLAGILEQILAPSQYEQNVKVKRGSQEVVEYAVKIPSKDDSSKTIYLPIDAKFPTADYEKLVTAYDSGNVADIENAKKELAKKIKSFAIDIKNKYINPPATTDFAVMYLPFESLYAEVLRIPELFETLQREHKIIISGPTTVAAFLNSLQIGFKSLAIEKRTSEIWKLLGAVKKDFASFGEIVEKTKEKLEGASKELDKVGDRSRQIEKKLRDVEVLPETNTPKIEETNG